MAGMQKRRLNLAALWAVLMSVVVSSWYPFRLDLPAVPAVDVMSGPRVGVSGAGGTEEYPWRFWLSGDPTVSRYKAAKVRLK